jgi:methyltransferase (TIGR00027 family)
MKPGYQSQTAEHMAFFRALESVRPPKQRLFHDPFAGHFLDRRLRLMADLARFLPFRILLNRYVDQRCPGARTSGIARTRLIDDFLTAALESGISQVVILGAGFDARAYRIPCSKAVRFFEVDHPDTLKFKQARLETISGAPLRNTRHVEIDFNRQSLRSALTQAGFDPAERTFFIWEGVTNYLRSEAVSGTLRFVGSATPRSQIIFTYVHRDFFRTPHLFQGAARLKRDLERLNEPWTFGLEPDEVPLLLKRCGLCLLKDIGSVEYRLDYFGKRCGRFSEYEFYRAALAEVNPVRDESSCPIDRREIASNA